MDPAPSGRTPRAKGGCEWRSRHRGRQPRRSGSASNRDRRREPLKRAPAHAGARGNEPRIPTKGTPWAEPGRFARGPRLTLYSLVAFEPYAGQRRLDQSEISVTRLDHDRHGHASQTRELTDGARGRSARRRQARSRTQL